MKLNTDYLGLQLDNPVIISSSPFTMTADRIRELEERGAGAVVLKSVFEEQILGEAAYLERYNSYYPEAADYLNSYTAQNYMKQNLDLIEKAKESVKIPVIASINCLTDDSWADYAESVESAGADALELNIFILPTDPKQKPEDIEEQYLGVIDSVAGKVKIPVSVKLGTRFTNVLHVCQQAYYHGAKGVVMFNRMFEPDFDIENISLVSADSLSSHDELRSTLRMVGMCNPQVPMLDMSVSTGVHSGADVVKAILAGAKAAQVCSALYLHGLTVIEDMKKFVSDWMEEHSFRSVNDFRGLLDYRKHADDQLYQRVQYMRFFPHQ